MEEVVVQCPVFEISVCPPAVESKVRKGIYSGKSSYTSHVESHDTSYILLFPQEYGMAQEARDVHR